MGGVEFLIEMLSAAALEIGDDVARVSSLGADLDTGDNAAFLRPGPGGIGKGFEPTQLLPRGCARIARPSKPSGAGCSVPNGCSWADQRRNAARACHRDPEPAALRSGHRRAAGFGYLANTSGSGGSTDEYGRHSRPLWDGRRAATARRQGGLLHQRSRWVGSRIHHIRH